MVIICVCTFAHLASFGRTLSLLKTWSDEGVYLVRRLRKRAKRVVSLSGRGHRAVELHVVAAEADTVKVVVIGGFILSYRLDGLSSDIRLQHKTSTLPPSVGGLVRYNPMSVTAGVLCFTVRLTPHFFRMTFPCWDNHGHLCIYDLPETLLI